MFSATWLLPCNETGSETSLYLLWHVMASVLDQPHQPAGDDGSPDEQCEAEGPEPDHHPGLRPHGDSEDDRGEQGEEQDSSKVRDRHDAFLPVASECASTAAMMFNSPATTMNFVP